MKCEAQAAIESVRPRTMPAQKPGKSVQEVGTPRAFLDAVIARFGRIVWDLAADESNHVVPGWSGPSSARQTDSLSGAWWALPEGLLWLNPPYANIGHWAAKCAREAPPRTSTVAPLPRRVALLVPASVGTNWFAEHVFDKAMIHFLRPRLTFVGHKDPYPKDLMLAVYGIGRTGVECWRWDK